MSITFSRVRRVTAVAAAVGLALSAASCANSKRNDNGGPAGNGGHSGTFVFAGAADPTSLDPFYASDGESFRPARQIFEGLVGTKPGTADPAPLLATSWKMATDGKSTTFQLRKGVKFSDGTPFNAKAVCANFDRWYNTPTGIAQSENESYYYISLFKGFKNGPLAKSANYKSCTTAGDYQVTVSLKSPFAGFVAALSLPSFSMQSPTAFTKYAPAAGKDPVKGAYATAHPTGTGAFLFKSWERGKQITLTRNPNYWGEKANFDTVKIVQYADPKARADALLNNEIDGFDLVGPADIQRLKDAGDGIVNRPAFNILYLGFNQKYKPLNDIRVRQAIAYAIDKKSVISSSMPAGTQPAKEFVPTLVNGYTPNVPTYDYNMQKAKDLLKAAGATNLTLEFNYPTDVSRPYMPSPGDTFNAIRSQLEKVGIKIKPVADTWSPDYLDKVQGTKNHGIHLLGWTGDYNDPDNFLGVFFGRASSEWGFNNPKLFKDLAAARQLPTVEQQTPVYERINQEVMKFLPGIPIASPVPSLAFAPNVKGFVASPVQDEPWNTITLQ